MPNGFRVGTQTQTWINEFQTKQGADTPHQPVKIPEELYVRILEHIDNVPLLKDNLQRVDQSFILTKAGEAFARKNNVSGVVGIAKIILNLQQQGQKQ